MPVNTRELLNAVSTLANNKEMKVTVKESVKAGCVAGAATTVGALLLGPAGIIAGGIIGVCTAAVMGHGKFKSVAYVIEHDMTPAQQERLAVSVRRAIADFRIEDAAMLLPLLLNNGNIQNLVITEVIKFLQGEMGLQIMP